MIHVRHAAAAITSGLCETVLITHGERGRSGVGRTRNVVAPTSLAGQFEQPYGPMGPPTLFTIPVFRYLIFPVAPAKAGARERVTGPRTPGFPRARERRSKSTSNWRWSRSCSANGRRRTRAPPSRLRSPSTTAEFADDRLPVPLIAVLPGDRWRRCLDPGRGRARPRLPAKAGLPHRHRRECRDPDGQPCPSFPRKQESRAARDSTAPWTPAFAGATKEHSSRAFRVAGPKAFAEAGITHSDVDHLMIYDAPCSLPGQASRICRSTASRIWTSSRAAKPAPSSPTATPPPAVSCRSTPMAAASPTCIPACTPCRRACARCAASPPPKSPPPGSRSATASAACSPQAARSSCPTSRLKPDRATGWV